MNSLKLILTFTLLVVLLSGCSLGLTPKTNGGGVYKSFDYGEHWEQKNFAGNNGKKDLSIEGIETRYIIFDQNDHALIYLATQNAGLFVSENAGEEWRQIFKSGYITSVTPDPIERGVIYLTQGNKIYKTLDFGNNWNVIYTETRAEVAMTSVAIDFKDTRKMFTSTSGGEILRSDDLGQSWSLITELDDHIVKVVINQNDSNILYAGTLRKGLFRSGDNGRTWTNLKDRYIGFHSSNKHYRILTPDLSVYDGLFFVTRYGLLRTIDGGKTWQDLNLVTPKNSVKIYTFAVNPQDANHIYYTTEDTVYRTFDGGENWLSARMPTKNAPTFMQVDPETPNVVYLGIVKEKTKPFFFVDYK
jgi:photosystem II stability/assembly factor-like uncharacterized protein